MDRRLIFKTTSEVIEDLRKQHSINNPIIKDDIIGILEKECTVVYYPLDDENQGFHIKRYLKGEEKEFVFINTSKKIVEQVFTAAHELGHIWNVAKKICEKANITKGITPDEEEEIINIFVAELLMPTDLFRRSFYYHFLRFSNKDNSVDVEKMIYIMVLLMNDYFVPYESVRRRLEETGLISKDDTDWLREENAGELVKVFLQDINNRLESVTEKKTIPDLRELIEEVQKGKKDDILITKIKKDFEIEDINSFDDIRIRIKGAEYGN